MAEDGLESCLKWSPFTVVSGNSFLKVILQTGPLAVQYENISYGIIKRAVHL